MRSDDENYDWEEEEEDVYSRCSYKNDDVQKYRDEAKFYHEEQIECQQTKQWDAAGRYKKKKIEANKKAERILWENCVNSKRPDTIDLHGFFVNEAICAVKKFLDLKIEGPDAKSNVKYVHVITGRGKHSNKNEAKIRPAVIDFLKKKNIDCYESVGRLKVWLPLQSPLCHRYPTTIDSQHGLVTRTRYETNLLQGNLSMSRFFVNAVEVLVFFHEW